MKLTQKQLRYFINEVIAGETVGGSPSTTCDCGTEMPLAVQQSGAGYYLGYFCPKCGPYSRESGYYRTREEAESNMEAEYGIHPDAMRLPPAMGRPVSEAVVDGETVASNIGEGLAGALVEALIYAIQRNSEGITSHAFDMWQETDPDSEMLPVRLEDVDYYAEKLANSVLANPDLKEVIQRTLSITLKQAMEPV